MEKFNRRYKCVIELEDEIITIDDFISCEAKIYKSCMMKLNTASFTFYNLAVETTSKLFLDRYDIKKRYPLKFYAGYDGGNDQDKDLHLVFRGDAIATRQARNGADITYTIECQDGYFSVANVLANTTFEGVTNGLDLFRSLADKLYMQPETNKQDNILEQIKFPRGLILNGNAFEHGGRLLDENIFIDNNILNYLPEDKVKLSTKLTIDAKNGLKNIPYLEGRYINPQTIFEPFVEVGMECDLTSKYEGEALNAICKVVGFTHNVTFSPRVNGDASTLYQLIRMKTK